MPKTKPSSPAPALSWDYGTAYELFISLHVLHSPETYGLRAAWAAGIRSRIPPAERKFLEEVVPFMAFPVGWIYRLPQPKDALSALYALRQIPVEKRLSTVIDLEHWTDEKFKALFSGILERGKWTKEDLAVLREAKKEKHDIDEKVVTNFLKWWVRPEEAGGMMLQSMQAYQQVFFEEEERRVAPVLKDGLERAQKLAGKMNLPELMVELSQGVNFNQMIDRELIIVPAYWTTPLVLLEELDEGHMLFLFGARPAGMSATPGELVPEGLLRGLKALADTTRLKILYYLSREELTPSELSRRLHLRAPTVTHHLSELRLAGLVNLTVRGQEKFYTARREALRATFENIDQFLDSEQF
jgi:DNA-binding transcriptional ArsR family regulator